MALKRKRSSAAFSSPASDASDATTQSTSIPHLPFFYHASKPVESVLLHKPTWSWPTYEDSHAHLNSRTRKRHRDNRPDEEQIRGVSCWIGAVMEMSNLADVCRRAANTINRLYEAQRQNPNAEPVLSQAVTTVPLSNTQRSTLHSFWKLPPATTVPMAIDGGNDQVDSSAVRCEDCDRSVRSDDAMDLDNDLVVEETRCQACQRQVCDTCAVLGDRRVCLQCATGAH